MKDIDFDELDRAVSSLMGAVPKDKPAEEADESAVTSDNTISLPEDEPQQTEDTITEEDAPAVDNEVPAISISEPIETEPIEDKEPEAPQESESPVRALVTPPPSRGRFMDVMRPTRDNMRKSSLPVSRQGVTLQPSVSSQPAESVEPVGRQNAYPAIESNDSLTVPAEIEDTASTASALNSEPTVEPVPATGSSSIETEDTTPLSSPFLPDAKVEKRPLGRPAEATPLVDLEAELAENNTPTLEAFPVIEEVGTSSDLDVDAQLPEEPLPAELDSKLLSIETDSTTIPAQETPVSTVSAPAAETAPTTSETSVSTPSVVDIPRAMAAASIPQQYKLENKPSEELPASAIYETQPLAHPANSRPGWHLVAAILGILILGAALGAGVYYLGLI